MHYCQACTLLLNTRQKLQQHVLAILLLHSEESPRKASSSLTPEFVRKDIETRQDAQESAGAFEGGFGVGHSSSFQLMGDEVCVHW